MGAEAAIGVEVDCATKADGNGSREVSNARARMEETCGNAW